MTEAELRALQGASMLVQSGVEAGAQQLLQVQTALAHLPYAALRHTPAPTCLINGIEKTQATITRGVYGSIVLGSRALCAAVDTALLLWEARQEA